MEDADINKIVLAYLHKKGFKQTESLFKEESKISSLENAAFDVKLDQDCNVANYILFHNSGEPVNVSVYDKSYNQLKKWVENSLDLYKAELDLLLYPIFVHCYLDLVSRSACIEAKKFMNLYSGDHQKLFGAELYKLVAVTDPLHLRDNHLAIMFRNNKYNLQLSSYSFELFISFLQENQFSVLLKIVNQYLNIKVVSGKPKQSWTADEIANQFGILGVSQHSIQQINEQSVFWGPLGTDPEAEEETMRILKTDLAKNIKSPEQIQAVMHQLKKIKAESMASTASPARDRIPLPAASATELFADVEMLKDFSKRAVVSHAILPSVVCYTMHNTYNSVSSISFSPDSMMMATGSLDSYIDLWSLKGEKFYSMKPSTELATMNLENIQNLSECKSSQPSDKKRLIGHSGPVYASRFSRDNKILLSGSKDGTVRLWQLDMFSSLVCYRAHRYPVWDLDYSPFGHYFVTGSADRTAKLWSTDCPKPLRIFVGHLSDVDVVRFHPNSNYVATGSSDCTVRLWDVQTGNCMRIFTGHTAGISALAFSPDGRQLASGAVDGHIHILDIGSAKVSKKLKGHEKAVYSLDFSYESAVLASGGADNCVKLWDAKSTVADPRDPLIGSFATKQTPISKVQFSYRNILFAAGSFVI